MRVMKAVLLAVVLGATAVAAQRPAFVPVTQQMLTSPSPDDWLMYSRTYDAQRHSPLTQITRQNVGQLREVFKHELGTGTQESIPIVYRGVMYVMAPGATVRAIDATNGTLIWEYKRTGTTRSKTLAIYDDMIFYTSPDGFIVALDARTGALRWETKTTGGMTSGVIVVEGKVISARACGGVSANCYIAAHDAKTGKEVWRFHTAARDDDPGGATWGGQPENRRVAGAWGLPGAYDPVRRLIVWGVANPTPNSRMARHNGNPDAVAASSPAELYSNSTIALNPDTGTLAWYYQHLPGDDWDLDYTNERTLLRSRVNPDPGAVKWINPDVRRGEERDMSVMIGEGGGIFANDRSNGQFLWATPFPFDTPDFLISHIDGKTGRVELNKAKMFTKPQERHVVCFWNTRSYWPTSYHPGLNSLYVPYVDNCLDMTVAGPNRTPPERRVGIPRPGGDMEKFAGLAKINIETGKITQIYTGRAPGNGAVLTTAGDVLFWGDLDQKFRAFDAESGKILWEQTLGGPIQNSTITYAVNGKQYVAVFSGEGLMSAGLMGQAGIKPVRGYNAVYVYALP